MSDLVTIMTSLITLTTKSFKFITYSFTGLEDLDSSNLFDFLLHSKLLTLNILTDIERKSTELFFVKCFLRVLSFVVVLVLHKEELNLFKSRGESKLGLRASDNRKWYDGCSERLTRPGKG
jgi:hypothetical protein